MERGGFEAMRRNLLSRIPFSDMMRKPEPQDLLPFQKHGETHFDDVLKKLEKNYTVWEQYFTKQVLECLCMLANSEMDTEMPGFRGMGRLSLSIPRFVYFIPDVYSLSKEEKAEIHRILYLMIRSGYDLMCCMEILSDTIEKPVRGLTTEDLMFRWLPCISPVSNEFFKGNLSQSYEINGRLNQNVISEAIQKVTGKKISLLKRFKFGMSVAYFTNAGGILRFAECGKISQEVAESSVKGGRWKGEKIEDWK